ncbi:hypothetical protein CFN78_02905 [Amycolatopsis antarctica]|uniref:Lantibiotic dehydratase n=1 Tax=Amycolatopsis antarctica TaxID=1854586 RepID=A0A263D9G9_9PSEU|nr:lantibiotic dehydratase [Amycolatopsis antarctica]OZM75130.1 hypothetical protein CFN78_02905 [Amycolatopsis antarctica]
MGELRGAGFVVLRAPVLPLRPAPDRPPEPSLTVLPGRPDETGRTVSYLEVLAKDRTLWDAVTLSSPALSRQWERILSGDSLGLPRLRRLALALTRYRLRLSARATPAGTLAGAAFVPIDDAPGRRATARLGGEHHRYPRPDMRWLSRIVAEHARQIELLRVLRVVLNDRCRYGGGRLVLSHSGFSTPQVSVRLTAPVRELVRFARRPVRGADLEKHLRSTFPAAPAEAVEGMLAHLVEHRFLLTDLSPPPDAERPLEHVLARLGTGPDRVRTELSGVDASLRRAEGASADQADVIDLASRMRGLYPCDRPVHLDLRLDAEIRLPREVTDEAARAAEVLWRLAPGHRHPARLHDYHQDFLERYGVDRLVPLGELLDPTIGLGPPAGYPLSTRPDEPEPVGDVDREHVLGELVQEAALRGDREIRLGERDVARLAGNDLPLPPSLELGAHLLADSAAAVDRGEFDLVLSGLDSPVAGAASARLAHMFGPDEQAVLAETARTHAATTGTALPLQLAVAPFHPETANLTRVPHWLPRRLAVDVLGEGPDVVTMGDVVVGADRRRLYLMSVSLDREIVPFGFHMLNPKWAPAEVRFLHDVGAHGCHRGWSRWRWGALDRLPYLPGVRYRRTVLCPARWRMPGWLPDAEPDFSRWRELFDQWRTRWAVPRHVLLAGRQPLPLDLDRVLHLRLLHTDCPKQAPATLLESFAHPDAGIGWLPGPAGDHHSELVMPLLRNGALAEDGAAGTGVRDRASVTGRIRPEPSLHLPGGDWISAKLYAAEPEHDELLGVHLANFAETLTGTVDRWFFLRYRDPEPHLRLRLRPSSPAAAVTTLRALHEMAVRLRADGLLGRLLLDTYEPELERYGGPEAIGAAEVAFAADSEAVIAQLALRREGRLDVDLRLLTAANCLDLCAAFFASGAGEPGWASSLLDVLPRGRWHQDLPESRSTVLALLDPRDGGSAWRLAVPAGAELLDVWKRRSTAVAGYGARLRDLGGRPGVPPRTALLSLLHMHHNRLAGIDPARERSTLAILRGALLQYTNAKRYGHEEHRGTTRRG